MKNTFDEYVGSLEDLAQKAAIRKSNHQDDDVISALDGGARLALETIPRSLRRETGIFFTNSLLVVYALTQLTTLCGLTFKIRPMAL